MAVLTNTNWFSNAIVGQPMAGADINVFDVNSTPKFAVGFGFVRSDGNRYRYSSFAEGFRSGWVMGPNRTDMNAGQASTATCGNTYTALAGEIPSNQVGSHYIRITSLTATAQQYNGCYATIYTGPGAGCTYRVKNTIASPVSGSADVALELYEPLIIALTTASTIMIASLPYNDLIRCVGGTSSTTLGSQFVSGIAVSSGATSQFGWVQTGGSIGALQGELTASGTSANVVTTSTVTPGAITVFSTSALSTGTGFLGTPILGTMVNPGSQGGFSQIYLTLE